jgi:hypothetical protein
MLNRRKRKVRENEATIGRRKEKKNLFHILDEMAR